jgi:hypothetical protein
MDQKRYGNTKIVVENGQMQYNLSMKKVIFIGIVLAPSLAFAADTTPLSTFVANMGGIVNQLIPILSTVVVLVFFYGLIKYILAGGDDEASKKARSYMIRGIIGMFVLTTIWGIIGFIQQTVGNKNAPTIVNVTLPSLTPGTVNAPQ